MTISNMNLRFEIWHPLMSVAIDIVIYKAKRSSRDPPTRLPIETTLSLWTTRIDLPTATYRTVKPALEDHGAKPPRRKRAQRA